jgi:murein DD-endopeptidase MepM/ murein hydrolase activator NlpD
VRGLPWLLVSATVLALLVAAASRADPPPAPTETTVQTTPATTTTTTVPPTTTDTTAAATTTVPVTTTAPAATTTAPVPQPAAATLAVAAAPQAGCPPVGAVGLLFPHQRPVVLAPQRQLSSAYVAYPADGSVLTASTLSLDTTCTDAHPTGGTAEVRGLSLFGGVVTARAATLDLASGAASVSGLVVGGKPVTLETGHPIRLGNWGYLISPDPSAPSRSAFEIELSDEHGGLPAGTLVFVPYAHIVVAPPAPAPPPTTSTETTTTETTVPATTHDESPGARPAAKKRPRARHKPGRQPLKVTPPLEAGPYVFPVAGHADFGDTYGAERSDVPGGWHHGDDIFAALGTPVVAVANGTLNRVGWERLGGWRLWVRDAAGDEFYYAHLSGYSPRALAAGRVTRGEVIGFVGNTGDAFTTLPHLHFEIHPRSLLHLQYDGAVDPTTYLQSWSRTEQVDAPFPVHPRLPKATSWRHEAAVNYRELLAARGLEHLTASSAAAAPFPPMRIAAGAPTAAVVPTVVPRHASSSDAALLWGSAAGALVAAALGVAAWRGRGRLEKLISR